MNPPSSTMLRATLLCAVCALSGCGASPSDRFFQPDASPRVDALDPGASRDGPAPLDASEFFDRGVIPIRDSGDLAGTTVVYAHSDTTLYSVDPASRQVHVVGTFVFPSDGHTHTMTDLAVDAAGEITGITQDALYTIDPATAQCVIVRALPATSRRAYVALTWVPVGVLDPGREVLLGGATDGSLWRIDSATGSAALVGNLPSGWGISGDLVSIAGAATYATVRRITGTHVTDTLATLDFSAGSVRMTAVGAVGVPSIFGLGYWRSTLYGFTRTGHLLTINVRTGVGTDVSMPAMQFSGAGVTTVAPVAPP